jgi:hypothetical protein
MTMDRHDMAVVLADAHHPAKRAFFAVAGLAAVIFPAWDMAPAFSGLSIFTPVFAIIVIGATLVGFAFLYGAILGDDSLLSADGSHIVWKRANLLRRRTDILSPSDIVSVDIRAVEWDSTADTWRVTVRTRDGKQISSSDFLKRDSAEKLRDSFAEKAGLA